MRVLILNPPDRFKVIEHPDQQGDGYLESDDFGRFPPLGALYVLSHLEKYAPQHQIFFKDCVAEGISHEQLGQVIGEIDPEVVGITSFTISLMDVCLAARTVRQAAPGAHLCLGGHHPIAFPFESVQLEEFDSVVVGEGEQAFTSLVQALEAGGDITAIEGVYTRDSMEAHRHQTFRDRRFLSRVMVPPAYISDLDALPMVNREHIKHIEYHSILGVTNKLATIISSRGCPYRCTYCDVPYKQYRRRAISLVVDEIEQCLAMGYQECHFYDDLFNITPKRVLDFCDELDRRGLVFPWDFRGRVNTATRESLQRAKQCGCRLISFGVETGTDAGLAMIKKKTTTARAQEVFRWCRELGIKTVADYMIGFPFERTKDDVKRSIEFLINLDPDYGQIGILTLYPNTAIFDQAVDQGLVDPGRWQKFAKKPEKGFMVDHWEEFLSLDELVELQKWGYRRFYFRPRYMLRQLFSNSSWYEFKTKAGGALKLLR